MGRHSSDVGTGARGGAGIAIFSVIAVVALVLVGWGVRSLVVSDDAGSQNQAASEGSGQSSGNDGNGDGDGEQEQPDMGGGESSQESSAPDDVDDAESGSDARTEQEPQDENAPEALAQCHARVAAGNAWAAATAASASNWKQHYTASVRYNDGKISLEQAEAEFAESKARGQDDIETVSAAAAEYSDFEGACSEVSVADLPDEWSQTAQRCLDRAEALEGVVATGTEVNGDWSEHLEMMRHKDEIDPDVYYERWRSMVRQAPTAMKPYEAAVADLDEAPTCSV
ncbi:MAG TPA: hypothetical protein VJ976_06040 [Ornithinimicrobium sp.]|uniref:hypothetical protein n=1 Tax=Ornithinimicrobium sp. TaxID=1977084 RepID=UPI002B45B876|nr:hypothetical protein [Ornithinimicrobium sp.]HKJ11934.1 hypothetical protein [Ornithinimicrobium sp.]